MRKNKNQTNKTKQKTKQKEKTPTSKTTRAPANISVDGLGNLHTMTLKQFLN